MVHRLAGFLRLGERVVDIALAPGDLVCLGRSGRRRRLLAARNGKREAERQYCVPQNHYRYRLNKCVRYSRLKNAYRFRKYNYGHLDR